MAWTPKGPKTIAEQRRGCLCELYSQEDLSSRARAYARVWATPGTQIGRQRPKIRGRPDIALDPAPRPGEEKEAGEEPKTGYERPGCAGRATLPSLTARVSGLRRVSLTQKTAPKGREAQKAPRRRRKPKGLHDHPKGAKSSHRGSQRRTEPQTQGTRPCKPKHPADSQGVPRHSASRWRRSGGSFSARARRLTTA